MGNNRRLTLEDRKTIEKLLHEGHKHMDICKTINIWRTTFYREMKKCAGAYNGQEAHENSYKSINYIDWDIIGKRFGLLTVLSYANKYKRRSWWKCQCDCGNTIIISRKILTEYCSADRQLSCGCIAKESRGPNGQVPIQEAALRKFQDLLTFREIKGRCWEWTGYRQKGKVPKTSWKNKSMSVRKCMYLIMNGITFEPNAVYAKCGNLKCFNPEHITLDRPAKRSFYTDQD